MHRNTQLLLLLFSDPVLGSEHKERKIKHSTEGSITEYSILTIGHHNGFGIHIPYL